MKRSFFQAAVTSILLYSCTTWTLSKRLEKKLDDNYTRMLRAILNKSWRQHPHKTPTVRPPAPYHENYSSWTNQTYRTLLEKRGRTHKRCTLVDPHTWPCKSRTTSTNIHSPARTYIQLCEDTGCCPEDLPRAMNNREEWRERVRDIRATSTT